MLEKVYQSLGPKVDQYAFLVITGILTNYKHLQKTNPDLNLFKQI